MIQTVRRKGKEVMGSVHGVVILWVIEVEGSEARAEALGEGEKTAKVRQIIAGRWRGG
jgi:hypothetical protein